MNKMTENQQDASHGGPKVSQTVGKFVAFVCIYVALLIGRIQKGGGDQKQNEKQEKIQSAVICCFL